MTDQSPNDIFKASSFMQGHNAEYLEQIYARYADDPASVDEAWQEFFRQLGDDDRDVKNEAKGPSWARADWPPQPGDDVTAALTGEWPAPPPAESRAAGKKIADSAKSRGVELTDDQIQRAVLDNGMQIYLAQREGVPVVTAQLSFDAGIAADPKDALGTQSLMLQTMEAGTTSLDATELAIAQERLGASISASANRDNTIFTLSALEPNLGPSFSLLADYVRNPAFDASELRAASGELGHLPAADSLAELMLPPSVRSFGERERASAGA